MEKNATRMKKLFPTLLLPSMLLCLLFAWDTGKSDFFVRKLCNFLVDYLEAQKLQATTEPQEGQHSDASTTSLKTSLMILAGSPSNLGSSRTKKVPV